MLFKNDYRTKKTQKFSGKRLTPFPSSAFQTWKWNYIGLLLWVHLLPQRNFWLCIPSIPTWERVKNGKKYNKILYLLIFTLLFHVRPVAVLAFCVSWFTLGFKTPCFTLCLRRCMERRRGIAMRKLSVCPSVCLSVKRVHCDKTEERSVKIFIPYKRSFSLVFWEEEWNGGGDPIYLKFWVNRPNELKMIIVRCPWTQNGRFSSKIANRTSLEESLLQSFFVWKLSAAKL